MQAEPNVGPDVFASAGQRINAAFTQPLAKRDKLTAARLFQSLEQILGRSKGDWSAILVRGLWPSSEEEARLALRHHHHRRNRPCCARTHCQLPSYWLILPEPD